MGGTIQSRRTIARSVRTNVNVLHAVRRLFGQSPGVNTAVLFIVLVTGLIIGRPLVMSAFSWYRTAEVLQERRAEVAELERTHAQLKEQVEYYRTDAFIAEQARSYGMVEPGERSFVIRELVHPQSAARFAVARLRNATVDSTVTLASPR